LSHLKDYEKGLDVNYITDGLEMMGTHKKDSLNEYKRIVNNMSGKDYPVSGITFYEALAYAKWADCDLPTEAQWEKAARGTDKRVFSWGNDFSINKINSIESSHPFPDGIKVNEKSEYCSPYGCVQMCGNVSEWCLDYFDASHYEYMPENNPCNLKGGQNKVIRGGATNKNIVFARTSSRNFANPQARPDFVGFRIVKNK
jgi:iron(II)-dependent oxidoreductase